ncbi:2-amino-4-oxopentanoate thiolase subunit OrtA [Alkaliphilus transvaalensis]|uniref:2-amino-4-oxopentanoate thiolase subunit OrtA n=1 Tax=Alkaliphilus transvaalensis TaxID=114628 RepID=UPI00047CE51C|nr:2-amino-4-oxopentanoate thiolase subunit OrtA [Alkaliphilus transvaalensis]
MKIEKGTWVRIHDIVLSPQERSPNLPEDTKKVPLEMWVKGFLLEEAMIGERVAVKTITGRNVEGTLLEANPYYDHDFGKFVPEILEIGLQLKEILWAGEGHD